MVQAIKTIFPGEAVTEIYGQVYTNMDRKQRQEELLNHFWFECKCRPCRENWPLLTNMSRTDMSFRCSNCCRFLCKNSEESFSLMLRCGRCHKPTNILKSLKALEASEKKYYQSVECLKKNNISLALGIALENIALYDTLLCPPFPDYYNCQEISRICMLRLGNKAQPSKEKNPKKV